MKDLVSVIVVNHNGLKYLKSCLNSLERLKYPNYEIIVIDNGSTDGTKKFMFDYQAKNKKTLFYDIPLNMGLAYASNKGASFAKGKYYLFLNNDTLVDPYILDKLTEMMTESIGVLGCRMGDYDGTRELDSFISVDRFGYPCGRTGSMFYPDGAIFISRKAFEEIGGFDKKLFLYGEDRDLCWRVWLYGYLVIPCPSAVFYHASSCVVDTNFFRRRIAERNIIRSLVKNYSNGYLWRIIPQYLFYSFWEILVLLLVKPQAIWKSYLPAYWWNIVNFRDTWQEHRKVQKQRRVEDFIIQKVMSKKIGKLFVLKKFGIPKFTARTK